MTAMREAIKRLRDMVDTNKIKKEKERINHLIAYYLAKLADLRKKHDKLLAEFIKELEKEREKELRSKL